MGSALFLDVTQRGMVVSYRRFWTTLKVQAGPSNMKVIGYPETSVRNDPFDAM